MSRIGITMGDPKGVGPELIAKAWKEMEPAIRQKIRIYGDRTVLDVSAKMVGTTFDPKQLVITSSVAGPVGNISEPDASRITLLALKAAIVDIKAGSIDALVTAPVNKFRMQITEPNFTGHTETLAKAAGVRDVIMMFACPPVMPDSTLAKQVGLPIANLCSANTKPIYYDKLRISLVTTHLPLKEVSAHISKHKILTTIHLTVEALKRFFDCERPRIAVLSLNPHAGEGGVLGTEEEEVIVPAIGRARKEGIICFGPFTSDALFGKKEIDFDAVIAMYHDQGLTPMKIICPDRVVNVTLGLPFVRTSPGHGTAEDIAWRGQARSESMISAIEMADHLLRKQGKV
ncbi:MAG: 4-hydroxythreonine-4-phosphate dehydrogenase PdxA [Pseudomonadota bacterium]